MASDVPGLHNQNTDTLPTSVRALVQDGRVNRALLTLSAGNHTLLHARDEQELLQKMCRVIVEKGGYLFAGVAYGEYDLEKSIRWIESVGIDKALLESFQFTWDDTELGNTAMGTAIRTGKPSVGRSLLEDPVYQHPHYAALRQHLLHIGYAATAAFPLHVDGKVLGALALGAVEPDAFDTQEVELLGELAANLAYGLGNLRTALQHREAQELISRLAFYDSMTGLANRTLLLERLDSAIESARLHHKPIAMLYLEACAFDEINCTFGYRAGDQLVRELAMRFVPLVRSDETLARVGDADFALVLPGANSEQAIRAAQLLMSTTRKPIEVSGVMVDSRLLVGIALYPGHASTSEALLRRAKAARNQARSVPEGYAIYAGGLDELNIRRVTLAADLRHAIQNNDLLLYCQPKVDVASGRASGAEVLVRWLHPQHGMIPPTEFVRLAEQSGLIVQLTNWVLEASFRQAYAWKKGELDYTLSVNLSVHDLRDPTLADRIRGQFAIWGIDPGKIQFEITESAMIDDPIDVMEMLAQLKELGVTLSIDDFGTGYSSLSHLQKLPVDSVKIDRSFVTPMLECSTSAVIVKGTIEACHNLNLEVVAEGVEDQATMDRLAEMKCDVAQGYLISGPFPMEQFADWNRQWIPALHAP